MKRARLPRRRRAARDKITRLLGRDQLKPCPICGWIYYWSEEHGAWICNDCQDAGRTKVKSIHGSFYDDAAIVEATWKRHVGVKE